MFGGTGEGIYPLDSEIFQNQFQIQDIDPRWLHYGVFKCPPNESRETWLYITSGMSNVWESEDPQNYSGFGTEFFLETNSDSDWPINTLRSLMAYHFHLILCVIKRLKS